MASGLASTPSVVDATTAEQEPQAGRRLFDFVNVPTLLFVAICFFLPLTKMSCGPIEISFSGLSMALGTAPNVNAPTPRERQQAGREIAEKGFRKSPFLLFVPAAGVVGALLSFRAFRGASDGVRPAVLAAAPALLTALLAYYWFAGFGVEREFAEDMARQPRDPFGAPASMQKTGWFYAALLASAVSLLLAAIRRASPRVVVENDGAVRLRFPVPGPSGAPPSVGRAGQHPDEGRIGVVGSDSGRGAPRVFESNRIDLR